MDINEVQPERVIHKFKFKDVDWAHVALVDKAANAQEVLTMKNHEGAGEVQITLTMQEFLNKFFHMWDEDAAALAGILGYDASVADSYYKEHGSIPTPMEAVQSRIDSVVLLKGMEIPDVAPGSVVEDITKLMSAIGDQLTSETKPDEVSTKKDSTLDITQEELDSLKSAAASNAKLIEDNETFKAQLAGYATQMKETEKATMVTCVKAYSFIGEEDQATVVDALLASAKTDQVVIIKALESARDAVTASAGIDQENGAEGEGADLSVEEDDLSKAASGGVQAIIDARNA